MKQLAIRLRKFGRICPISGYKEQSIRVGALVIVVTDRGEEIGQIVAFERGLPRSIARDVRLKKVLRYATEQDLLKMRDMPLKEEEALKLALQKIQEYELSFKIVGVEGLFDGQKIYFYYRLPEGGKAPNLKGLVRDLSLLLKMKVDFKQVNPRDEARLHGGLGPCGRPLCCASWLEKPKHITVKMVKGQGLSLSPLRTSGICGRLMCCLEYEYEGKEEKK